MNKITNIHGETIKGYNNIYGECQGRKVQYKPIPAKGNNSNESWVYTDTGEVLKDFYYCQ
jgi:hypothetical protein